LLLLYAPSSHPIALLNSDLSKILKELIAACLFNSNNKILEAVFLILS
jgi:hypothetical protein